MDASFLSDINWLAVLVAAIAYFLLGAVWYSFLFQKQWIKLQNINVNDPEIKKGMATTMFTSFLLMLLATIGLALLVERLDLYSAISGIKIGLLTGVCFSLTAISITYLYTRKPVGLHFIDGFYHVVGQVIAGVILCMWR
jgi:hypothetical protein